MLDYILTKNLSVDTDAIRFNPRLDFGGLVNEDTGAVLSPIRKSTDRGLTFTLVHSKTGDGTHCELEGSIHKFFNDGLHNADQFPVRNVLAALDQLVTANRIDPFNTLLNSVEFAVNVLLPFPAMRVIDNLISYKGKPFHPDPKQGRIYWQCVTQRYIVKIYAKGLQFPEFVGAERADYLLRVEIKVIAMEYFIEKKIPLLTLNDLLNVANYERLGRLLVEAFSAILFDEPTVDDSLLTTKERNIYQNGRNPRIWAGLWKTPDDISTDRKEREKELDRLRNRRTRAEKSYRALLDKHRAGANWQNLTATLIGQTWQHLTTTDDALLTAIDQRRAVWQMLTNVDLYAPVQPQYTATDQPEPGRETVAAKPEKCPVLKGVGSNPKKGGLSGSKTIGLLIEPDTVENQPQPTDANAGRETVGQSVDNAAAAMVSPSARCCKTTGLDITHQPARTKFVTRSTVRRWYDLDRGRFNALAGQYLTEKQAGADLDKRCYHIAHNIRNTYTNPRNNPVRVLKKYGPVEVGQTLPLFPVRETVRLTDRHLTALDYRRGTRWELPL